MPPRTFALSRLSVPNGIPDAFEHVVVTSPAVDSAGCCDSNDVTFMDVNVHHLHAALLGLVIKPRLAVLHL